MAHRSSLPNGHRPFESFESIFLALGGLDPEKQGSFYFPRLNFNRDEDSTDGLECDEVQ